MTLELPPRPQGTAEQQLAALRDYLVRLAQSLEPVGGTALAESTERAVGRAQEKTAKELRSQAEALKAIIVKNAGELAAYADAKVEEYNALYVAQSDFGSYYNRIESKVAETARGAVESFHITEAIEDLDAFMSELCGQIRRGVVEDPETHEQHLGIAISESLSFTGRTQSAGGATYYELSPGQTLGLYTSAGWQFWINGVRRGWFSSEDSMLHISNAVIENRLQFGGGWEITGAGGFGLRYIGG